MRRDHRGVSSEEEEEDWRGWWLRTVEEKRSILGLVFVVTFPLGIWVVTG